jgi:hypothetical protein
MLPEQRSGTGLVNALSIRSTTTSVNLDVKGLAGEISYYESLDSPTISMTISVIDGAAVRTTLPIIGGEIVSYNISDSYQSSDRIRGNMRLYKLSNKIRVQQNVDAYDIFMTSDELLRDQYTLVSNSFDNRNVDEMVRKIFDNHIAPISSKKLVTIEPTEGLFTSAFPRMSPFSSLKYLSDEAKSADRRSTSNYFFFENYRGYHFVSFQYLIKQPIKRKFYLLEDYIENDRQYDRQRVISIQEPVSFDMMDGVTSGQFGTQVLALDTVAKRFRSSQYLYNRDFSSVDHSSKNPRISPQTSRIFGSSISREKFIVSNSYRGSLSFVSERESDTQNDYRRRQEFLGFETASRADLLSNVTKVMVHGDSGIAAGDTIEILVPQSGESRITRRQFDGFVGGKYLVTAVAHRFGGAGATYGTVMECVKDSYSQPVNGRQ